MKVERINPNIFPTSTFKTYLKPVTNIPNTGTIEVAPKEIHPSVHVFYCSSSRNIILYMDSTTVTKKFKTEDFDGADDVTVLVDILNYMYQNGTNILVITNQCEKHKNIPDATSNIKANKILNLCQDVDINGLISIKDRLENLIDAERESI